MKSHSWSFYDVCLSLLKFVFQLDVFLCIQLLFWHGRNFLGGNDSARVVNAYIAKTDAPSPKFGGHLTYGLVSRVRGRVSIVRHWSFIVDSLFVIQAWQLI